ncbi:MAG: PAS domain-containing sensor histidine kinase [Methanomicrobiales archaeon]|nr:PAS domain-containing sensor histidine kinase [Methanomicrobiales archaeon]
MIWFQGISDPARHADSMVFSGVILDISERKAASAALLEEAEKYRTLVDHSQDAVLIVQDGKLVFVNSTLLTMLGYGTTGIIGHPLGEIVAPEDRILVTRRNEDRVNGLDVPEFYEFSLLHADGKTRIRIMADVGVATYRGRPAVIGTLHNITCELQREADLKKSEQKYRELAELLPQMVFEMDPRMKITYANRHALKMLGMTPADVENGINAIDYIDPAQRPSVMEGVKKLLSGEPYDPPEYTAIRKDGSRFPALIYAAPIVEDGALAGFRGVIVDISTWKAATAARQESEERYRSLAEAARDIIYIIDKNDTVLYVNSYGLQVLDKTAEEVTGRPRSALFSGESSARMYQTLQRVFTTGTPLRIESRIPLPKGESWQDTHFVPLKGQDGTFNAVLAISRDITQLKRAEMALKRSNEKLNLLNSITRHDVANQLTILNGYIQLAMMKEPGSGIGDFLKKIQNACDTIHRQILFTRAYQDLGIKAPDWFRLDRVFEKTRPPGVTFTVASCGYEIYADPMLEKVFFNLFDNAIRHGGHVTSILVRCEMNGDELKIIVEDDGVGIPLDEKQKIFTKGFGKNTGYGLFLVREILAITNMAIHETGKHGRGARFEISVPKGGYRGAAQPGDGVPLHE